MSLVVYRFSTRACQSLFARERGSTPRQGDFLNFITKLSIENNFHNWLNPEPLGCYDLCNNTYPIDQLLYAMLCFKSPSSGAHRHPLLDCLSIQPDKPNFS